MDQVAAAAEAVAIAGIVAALVQERFSKLDGTKAFIAAVAISLAIGIVAVIRTGGFAITGDPTDPFGIAASILAAAGGALVASQAAFRVLIRPIAK